MTEKEAADAFLKFLEDRFRNKIDPDKYYLAYSGGKDSHLLYWFIREWLHENRIIVVGVNTSFEIPEIRDRILKNSDVVLHPVMHRNLIKEKYGIPCFSKQQDEYIYRYQRGNRSENTMRAVIGKNPIIKLNNTARTLLLSGDLHRISNKCCEKNKETPMIKWGNKYGRKAITGVRGSESKTRKAKYTSCLHKNGNFTPIYDWTDEMVDLVYRVYDIEIPSVYQTVDRTGCAGCPYGRRGHPVENELALLPRLQRKAAIRFFKESYDVLGINYEEEE